MLCQQVMKEMGYFVYWMLWQLFQKQIVIDI